MSIEQITQLQNEKQKILDIAFQCLLTRHDKRYSEFFDGKTDEEVAEWMADQYNQCGIENSPCGSSWAVLK